MIRQDAALMKPFSIFHYHHFPQHTWHVMMFLYESECMYVTKYTSTCTTNLNATLLRVLN